MKVKIFALVFFLVSFVSLGQNKMVKIYNEKIGLVSATYLLFTDLESHDSIYAVSFSFQNAKYTSLTDTKSIIIHNKESLNELIKDFKSAYNQLILDEKVSMDWNKKEFSLSLYDFSKNIYFKQGSNSYDGYTMLNKNQTGKLLEYLSKIEFGSMVLMEGKKLEVFLKE